MINLFAFMLKSKVIKKINKIFAKYDSVTNRNHRYVTELF